MIMIQIPVSLGELIDKITILEIKQEMLTDASQLQHVNNELHLLTQKYNSLGINLDSYKTTLKMVNRQIWMNEHKVRNMNLEDLTHVAQVALDTYTANTKRAKIKLTINQEFSSEIVEMKSYIQEGK